MSAMPLLAYILHERNADDRSEYVFPNKVQPGKRLSYKSIGTIVSGVFDKLGLRPGESHRGIGVFRHNLATRLLGAGTESVIISGILGIPALRQSKRMLTQTSRIFENWDSV